MYKKKFRSYIQIKGGLMWTWRGLAGWMPICKILKFKLRGFCWWKNNFFLEFKFFLYHFIMLFEGKKFLRQNYFISLNLN